MILVFCFIIFLFCLYTISKDDFVFLRKNITLEHIFNLAFIIGVVGIFSARIVYVAFHFSPNFLNPLVFLVIPYFPGLSFIGAIMGTIIYLFFYTRSQKLPFAHVLDCFSLAILAALPFAQTFHFIEIIGSLRQIGIVFYVVEIVSYVILFFAFLKIFHGSKLKDGSIALLFLIYFSFFSLIAKTVLKGALVITLEEYFLIGIFITSIVLVLRNDK